MSYIILESAFALLQELHHRLWLLVRLSEHSRSGLLNDLIFR
jgi:hypothetical protein